MSMPKVEKMEALIGAILIEHRQRKVLINVVKCNVHFLTSRWLFAVC